MYAHFSSHITQAMSQPNIITLSFSFCTNGVVLLILCRVTFLYDSVGSMKMDSRMFEPLIRAGGRMRFPIHFYFHMRFCCTYTKTHTAVILCTHQGAHETEQRRVEKMLARFFSNSVCHAYTKTCSSIIIMHSALITSIFSWKNRNRLCAFFCFSCGRAGAIPFNPISEHLLPWKWGRLLFRNHRKVTLTDREECTHWYTRHHMYARITSHYLRNILYVLYWHAGSCVQVLVVDDRVAFCGGMNQAQEYCGTQLGGTGFFRGMFFCCCKCLHICKQTRTNATAKCLLSNSLFAFLLVISHNLPHFIANRLDTLMRVEGPAVQDLRDVFLESMREATTGAPALLLGKYTQELFRRWKTRATKVCMLMLAYACLYTSHSIAALVFLLLLFSYSYSFLSF